MRRRRGSGSVEVRGASWELRYRTRKGTRSRVVLGRLSEMTEQQAHAAADTVVFKMKGTAPGASSRIADVLEDYRVEMSSYLSDSTVQTRLNCYVVAAQHFGDEPVGAIGRPEAQRFVVHLRNRRGNIKRDDTVRKMSPNTVRVYARYMKFLWEWLCERGMAQDNPWTSVRLPGAVRRDTPVLEAYELDTLIAHVADLPFRDLFKILGETGLRYGEALALRAQDVRNGRLYVRESKTREPRSFKLTQRAAEFIANLKLTTKRRGADRLIQGIEQTPADRSKACRRLHKALEAAGLPRMRIHDLRHSYGYRMGAAGATEAEIAEVLGHRDTQTTALYVRHKPGTTADRGNERMDAHETPDRVARAASAAS